MNSTTLLLCFAHAALASASSARLNLSELCYSGCNLQPQNTSECPEYLYLVSEGRDNIINSSSLRNETRNDAGVCNFTAADVHPKYRFRRRKAIPGFLVWAKSVCISQKF